MCVGGGGGVVGRVYVYVVKFMGGGGWDYVHVYKFEQGGGVVRGILSYTEPLHSQTF